MLLHADLFSRWPTKVERVDHPKPPFLRQREASYFAAGDSVVGFRPDCELITILSAYFDRPDLCGAVIDRDYG
jgi:hypothetical protein